MMNTSIFGVHLCPLTSVLRTWSLQWPLVWFIRSQRPLLQGEGVLGVHRDETLPSVKSSQAPLAFSKPLCRPWEENQVASTLWLSSGYMWAQSKRPLSPFEKKEFDIYKKGNGASSTLPFHPRSLLVLYQRGFWGCTQGTQSGAFIVAP